MLTMYYEHANSNVEHEFYDGKYKLISNVALWLLLKVKHLLKLHHHLSTLDSGKWLTEKTLGRCIEDEH